MFTILVTEKGGSQQRLEFDEEVVTFGRVQGNQVMLPRGNVSKRHAKLELKNGQFMLTDLGSTNGTYINGRRVAEPTQVRQGDKVYIGEFILGFEGHEAFEQAEAAAPAAPPPRAPEPKPAAKPKPRGAAPPPKAARPSVPRPSKVEEPPAPVELDDYDDDEEGDTELKRSTVSSIPPDMDEIIARDAAPRPTARSSSSRRVEPPDTALGMVIEQLLDGLARQIKRLDRGNVPCQLDSGTAGKVRIVLRDLVGDLESRGDLPADVDPGVVMGKAFRSAVDLGPLSGWLDDPEVQEIRITRPDAVALFKGGEWTDAPAGYVGQEELAEALRCLGAGIEGLDESGIAGLARFRLEEGPLVLAALTPVASSGPSAVIHKNLSARLDVAGAPVRPLADAARKVVEEAIASRARIAVVGASGPVRLSVITDLARMLPAGDHVVGVEDLPLIGHAGPRRVGIAAHGLRSGAQREPVVGRLLSRAVDMEPDWIVVTGSVWADVPDIVACTSGRRGVLVDLPLGGRGGLDRALMAALAVSGVIVDPAAAASVLKTAFDVVVVAARTRIGVPAIRQIAATGLGTSGEWSAKVVYDASARG
jgi:pilus assembly protein CpaF